MNAKENALEIIRFGRPERVLSDPPMYLLHYFGCNHEGFEQPSGHEVPVGTRWEDIWGTVWQKVQEGVMGLPKGHPLAEPAALRSYRWPDPNDDRICGQLYRQAAEFPNDARFLTGYHRDTLWEKAYMLVGMENLCVYFRTEPAFVREVLHRIMDFQLGIAAHYLRLGVELVALGDDLGAQSAPLLSPWIVEEFLVPEYERLFQLYRERNVLIWFHSCGHIEPFIETFIRLGVNILNPVQASANDLDRLRTMTQGRMALHGGVSSAVVMEGPPERIKEEVRHRIWQLGQQGGYFCAPDQSLPFPDEHVAAFRAAVEQYGRYPLSAL